MYFIKHSEYQQNPAISCGRLWIGLTLRSIKIRRVLHTQILVTH